MNEETFEFIPINSKDIYWWSVLPFIADVQAKILPGVTHWQSPDYFAYFPSNSSIAGFLGEMLSAGINMVGFSWITSPAATELEMIVLDWLAKALKLPDEFLSTGIPFQTNFTYKKIILLFHKRVIYLISCLKLLDIRNHVYDWELSSRKRRWSDTGHGMRSSISCAFGCSGQSSKEGWERCCWKTCGLQFWSNSFCSTESLPGISKFCASTPVLLALEPLDPLV